MWRGFPDALHLATGVPVLAYSRAGYGWSDADDLPRPLDWMTREAGVLAEVLDAFGVTAPVLVGHSDGATIAGIAAGTGLRDRVRAVALMAPHVFTEQMGLAEIARAAADFDASGMAERMAKYHRDPVATFRGWADAWLSPGFRDWNVEAAVAGIVAPVLLVQGRDDQYGTLAQIDAIAAAVAGPVKRLVLDGVRHVPHLEQPEEVVAAIQELCNIIH